jgi:4-hydroxybenzoate polyprenyltransferase
MVINMKEFFKLVRWTNLIIVAFTMILMRYEVIKPLVEKSEVKMILSYGQMTRMSLQLPLYDFILLIIATLFITGAGYIINDYFDIKTDLINRGKVIVGTQVPRRKAMMWHNILNLAGVALGFYVSWKDGYFMMGILFLLVSGLLYFYSASYKRQFLIGNIIVALLTAMVPMLVVIFEAPAIYQYYKVNSVSLPDIRSLFFWVGGFAIFAFLTTLIREIIKDIEDYEGDLEYGRNTLPIVAGIKTTRTIVICLILMTILLLYTALFLFINYPFPIVYLSGTVVLPMIYIIFLMIKSETRNQFHLASRLMKIIMMTGILFSLILKTVL